MRLNSKKYVAAFVFSLVTLPVWAAHTDSVSWDPMQPSTIGSTQVKPGHYQLRAEEGQSQLQVVQGGKVIATVPCHWTQLPSKPSDTEIKVTNNQVTEVDFGGRTQAIQFN